MSSVQGEIAFQLEMGEDEELTVLEYTLPKSGKSFSKKETQDLYLSSKGVVRSATKKKRGP